MIRKNGIPDSLQFRIRINGRLCVYCGELANSLEHFPPASYSLHGYLFPACSECNVIAGTSYPLDFLKRAKYVNIRLREKYKKELRVPEWADDEIETLKYNLKIGIIQWQKMQRIARERVAWNAATYLANIDLFKDFVALDALRGITLERELIL